jgi:alkylation response protein AidB-like acyl-CoA dehydrogenase
MSIGITEDHAALAESVRGFVARHAPSDRTRADLDAYAAGALPAYWDALVEQGLTSLHLSEEYGGAGAGALELAVVLEETARGLLPGPLLPSLLTSTVLARHGDDGLRKRTLPALAAGGRAATALTTTGLRAVRTAGGYSVSGTSVPVLGAVNAGLLLLGAQLAATDGTADEIWFVVDTTAVGAADAASAVDQTRGVGRVNLDGIVVGDEHVVAVDTAAVRTLAAVLFAAEAVGIGRWLLSTGTEYVKIREQFGRPVGSFQAIKHRCARMFVRIEMMSAAAWDAARAVEQNDEQLALAATAAAVTCLAAATELGLETITLLGGIGYTWEHDAHLYWRRAMTMESLLGPVTDFEHRLGGLVGQASRDFRLELPDVAPGFGARIAEILAQAAALPDDRDRHRLLADQGLVLPHYPRPYGIGATPAQQLVIQAEYERSGVVQPRLKTQVSEWALPTIVAHGSQQQKDTFFPATLRGEIGWCQLFSEPGAGSDLASLATRAEKVDGGWLLNGQKVWSSGAREAEFGICLARTNPTAPKHKGISYFLIDMSTPGLDIRPLREASGHYLFNEVFFNDVFVPDDRLVGEVDQGWVLARTTLGNERVSMGELKPRIDLPRAVADLGLAASGGDVLADIGAVSAQSYAISAMGLRSILRSLSGLQPGAEGSVTKLAAGLANADASARARRWLGPEGAAADGPGGEIVEWYLMAPTQLIGGGTTEIQLNVIAERILGLPRG